MLNAHYLFILADIRHKELLAEAERNRLANQATRRNEDPGLLGSSLRSELRALWARLWAMRQQPDLTKPIDFTPAASETT